VVVAFVGYYVSRIRIFAAGGTTVVLVIFSVGVVVVGGGEYRFLVACFSLSLLFSL